MNDRPRAAQLAAEALAAAPIAAYTPDPREEERIIAAMAGRISSDARGRRMRGVATVLAAAAVVALATSAALVGHRHTGVLASSVAPPPAAPAVEEEGARAEGERAWVIHRSAEIALNGDFALAEGDRVVASPAGQATIRLPSGARLAIEPGAQVSLLRQRHVLMFALDVGSLRATVVAVPDAQPLLLRTGDAEIELRGASVRVATGDGAACGGHLTRVEVESGSATVRSAGREDVVAPGAPWPVCGSESAPPVALPRLKPKGKAHRGHAAPPPETSELRAQNELYGEALAAKRSGDPHAAIARFEQYLSLYPDSALAESASVGRMELLDATDHARAVAAARAYIDDYPNGHARAEAARIIGAP